jgi:hypothetical protein
VAPLFGDEPGAFALAAAGDQLVWSRLDKVGQIRRGSISGGFVEEIAGNQGPVAPSAVAALPGGLLWAQGGQSDEACASPQQDGVVLARGTADAAPVVVLDKLPRPWGLAAAGPDAYLTVLCGIAAADSGKVLHLAAEGGVWKLDPTPVATGQQRPRAVRVDGAFVYWTTAGAGQKTGAIWRAPRGGGAARVIASGQTLPYALAADPHALYWTSETGELWRMSKADLDP